MSHTEKCPSGLEAQPAHGASVSICFTQGSPACTGSQSKHALSNIHQLPFLQFLPIYPLLVRPPYPPLLWKTASWPSVFPDPPQVQVSSLSHGSRHVTCTVTDSFSVTDSGIYPSGSVISLCHFPKNSRPEARASSRVYSPCPLCLGSLEPYVGHAAFQVGTPAGDWKSLSAHQCHVLW